MVEQWQLNRRFSQQVRLYLKEGRVDFARQQCAQKVRPLPALLAVHAAAECLSVSFVTFISYLLVKTCSMHARSSCCRCKALLAQLRSDFCLAST